MEAEKTEKIEITSSLSKKNEEINSLNKQIAFQVAEAQNKLNEKLQDQENKFNETIKNFRVELENKNRINESIKNALEQEEIKLHSKKEYLEKHAVEIKKAEEIVIQKNEEVNQKNLILEQKVQEINKNNEPIPNQFAGVEGVKHDDVNVVVDVNIESNKIEIKQEETTSSVVPDVKIQIDEKSTVPVNIAEKPKEEIEKSNDLTKVVSNEESDFSPSVEFKKLDEKVLDLASRKQYLDIDLEDFIGVLLHEKLTNLFNDLDSKHLDAFSLEPVYNTLFGYISNPHEEKIDLINKQLEALGKLMGEGFANDDIGESEYHLALNVTDPCHDNAILVKMPPVPKIDSIDKEIISINS
jgi:hypothetical protein